MSVYVIWKHSGEGTFSSSVSFNYRWMKGEQREREGKREGGREKEALSCYSAELPMTLIR